MRRLRAAWQRTTGLAAGRRRDRDLDAELESHLQLHIDDNVHAGMSPDDARRQALLALGGLEQTKERYRDQRGIPAVEAVISDVRFAFRLMRRSPGLTAVLLLTLAIGIGANSMMFSVVNTLLLRPLPYHDPEALVSVRPVEGADRSPGFAAPPDFYTYRADNRTFDGLDAYYNRPVNLTGGLVPERILALTVSSGFFSTLGIPPALGRGFLSQEEQWGSHRVVVLGDGLWQTRFGADPGIVGQPITLDGVPHVVVGVLPAAFSFLGFDVQLFLPMAFEPGDGMNSHSNYFLRMVGRLKAGVSVQQATADLTRMSDAIVTAQAINQDTSIDVSPLRDALVRDTRRATLVLLGAVGLVLVIACANLAGLLIGRAAVRQREIEVRLALGATRARLLRQFLIESLAVTLTGGALGLAVAYALTDALNQITAQVLPRVEPIVVDRTVLGFTCAVAVLTGVALGFAPAIHARRASPGPGLHGTRTVAGSLAANRLRAALVAAEVALSLVLLIGAGLMVKSMQQLLRVEAGFVPDNVVTAQINLPARYVDAQLERRFDPRAYARSTAFVDELIARGRSLEGAQVVGAINGLPLMGEVWGKHVVFWDRPLPASPAELLPIQYRVVAGDYFRALGVAILSGRAFDDGDAQASPKVAIVNRELVRRYWNGQDPIGKTISVNPPLEVLPPALVAEARKAGTLPDDYAPDRFTVVGVAADARYGSLATPPPPLVYVPFSQGSEGTTNMYLLVRTTGDPLAVVPGLREQVAQIDRDQPVANVRTMSDRMAASVAEPRLQAGVLGSFAGLAALLAAIGIYGVMSFAVTQRSRELGIRLALGATRLTVIALVLRQGAVMVLLGLATGLAASLLLTRVLGTLLYGVSPTDPAVFASIVAALAACAWVSMFLPARRASRVDPVVTLRAE